MLGTVSGKPAFVERLSDWQVAAGFTQRQLAAAIGVHESLLSMIRSGERNPSRELMSRAIAAAPEPWKSALKQARQADLEAADAAMAVA
jgi:transcriptional regulator with XRE-family HTH domain